MSLSRALARPGAAAIFLLTGCNGLGGKLVSTQSPAGGWTFVPTRCTANAGALVLSSATDPLRYILVAREDAPSVTVSAPSASTEAPAPPAAATAPSILASQAGRAPLLRLTVLDLASQSGAPAVFESRACDRLSMQASPSFTTRVNGGPWIVSYSGTADIDCDGHRLVGHFIYTCPEE